jgi:hypothetical protein
MEIKVTAKRTLKINTRIINKLKQQKTGHNENTTKSKE